MKGKLFQEYEKAMAWEGRKAHNYRFMSAPGFHTGANSQCFIFSGLTRYRLEGH